MRLRRICKEGVPAEWQGQEYVQEGERSVYVMMKKSPLPG